MDATGQKHTDADYVRQTFVVRGTKLFRKRTGQEIQIRSKIRDPGMPGTTGGCVVFYLYFGWWPEQEVSVDYVLRVLLNNGEPLLLTTDETEKGKRVRGITAKTPANVAETRKKYTLKDGKVINRILGVERKSDRVPVPALRGGNTQISLKRLIKILETGEDDLTL